MKRVISNLLLLIIILALTMCTNPEKAYYRAKNDNTVEAFKEYLEKYPESPYLDSARHLLYTVAYELAKDTNTMQALESYILAYPQSPFIENASNDVCLKVFEDSLMTDTLLLKSYYNKYQSYKFSDSIAKKVWDIIKTSSILNYGWYSQYFPLTPYDSTATKVLNGIEYTIVDDTTILFTKGFDYQRDYTMKYSSDLHILKERGGLFTTTGMSVIPYCNLAEESKRSRDNPNPNDFFGFTPIESAVNMNWVFADSVESVTLFLADYAFEFVPNSTYSMISFKKDGVLVKSMTIIPSMYYYEDW